MTHKKTFGILFVLFALAGLTAGRIFICGTASASSSEAVIRKIGSFRVGASKSLLTVASDTSHNLRFTLTDQSGTQVFSSDIDASALQRWLLCVAADGSIWLYSADIGTYVWFPLATGYERVALAVKPELADKMPPALWTELPQTLQKKFPRKIVE